DAARLHAAAGSPTGGRRAPSVAPLSAPRVPPVRGTFRRRRPERIGEMTTQGSRGRGRRCVLRAIVLGFALAAAAAAPALAHSAVRFFPCYGSSGVRCATVAAPLDYSGHTPGELPLAVEELPAQGIARGVMFLVAGGPGQASAKVFDLAHIGKLWQLFFPGYTLVAYDDRGTGASGPLSCPGLLAATPGSDDNEIAALVGACGASL